QGSIDTKENDIHLFDTIFVRYGDTIIRTDQLHYNKKSHIIYSNVHVTINSNDSILESDSLKIDLNKNTLLLKGHFLGILSDSFDFPQ
ncbi:MAG: LPS export ABC transporter periplasmic protein LptC, partial [Desulfamplus sp.]|nr:LPS export ABC transporter periplasmic protein LptC [Desulfamplus sp.]